MVNVDPIFLQVLWLLTFLPSSVQMLVNAHLQEAFLLLLFQFLHEVVQ